MLREIYLGPCELPTMREWHAIQLAEKLAIERNQPFCVVDQSSCGGSDIAIISEDTLKGENLPRKLLIYLTK